MKLQPFSTTNKNLKPLLAIFFISKNRYWLVSTFNTYSRIVFPGQIPRCSHSHQSTVKRKDTDPAIRPMNYCNYQGRCILFETRKAEFRKLVWGHPGILRSMNWFIGSFFHFIHSSGQEYIKPLFSGTFPYLCASKSRGFFIVSKQLKINKSWPT